MSTFKFHNDVGELVNWQATYQYPSQQTRIKKTMTKLPPKNGGTFTANQTIRIEMPADGYMNGLNSTLQFDLETSGGTTVTQSTSAGSSGGASTLTFTGGATTMAGYVAVWVNSYGVSDADFVVTSTATTVTLRNQLLADVASGTSVKFYAPMKMQQGGGHQLFKRIRVSYGTLSFEDLMEYATQSRMLLESGAARAYGATTGSILDMTSGGHWSDGKNLQSGRYVSGEIQAILACYQKRTIVLNLLSGFLSCRKALPFKWMGGTVSVELTLAPDAEVYLSPSQSPTSTLTNINYLAELYDFDSTYDAGFLNALQKTGVPFLFSSYHYHSFVINGSNQQFLINERARSCKNMMAVIKDSKAPSYKFDTHWFYHDMAKYPDASGILQGTDGGIVQSYQTRVGGSYLPGQPVSCINGGAEAHQELLKVLDTLGDYRSDSNITMFEWSAKGNPADPASTGIINGIGNKFIIAVDFETTDINPDTICGLNAEEQNDIALIVRAGGAGPDVVNGPKILMAFVSYDAMINLSEGNKVALII